MSTKQLRQAITPTHILGSAGTLEGSDLGYQSKAAFVVGTVSQSGGVPTGAIIERGANANGEYVRYADGTQICWGAFDIGGVWPSGIELNRSWTFPASFASVGVVRFNYVSGTAGGGVAETIGSGTTSALTMVIQNNTGVDIGLGGGNSERRFAIGRWF